MSGRRVLCAAAMGGAAAAYVLLVRPWQLAWGTAGREHDEDLGDDLIANLEQAVERTWPKPKLLILSFPHNPTTAVVDRAFFERVVDFARANDLMVIHDFAYAEIRFDGYKPPSILEVPGAKDIGIESTSLSKSHSMARWRVGFACGYPDMVHALGRIKSYLDYGMPQAIQIGAIVALRGPQDVVQENCEEYKLRRDALIDGLGHEGPGAWKIEKPLGTMFVWARIPEPLRSLGSLECPRAGVARRRPGHRGDPLPRRPAAGPRRRRGP